MRHLAMACLCLAAAACGGDFSNDDLEFLNALPRREDLAAKLPASREGRAGGGLTARKAGLAVKLGEVSALATDTDETGRDFNSAVDGLLTLLERIRDAAPTTREPDRRVWGPFRDKDRPGFDVRFVMERQERFDYQLEYRRTGEGDDAWWALLSGAFQADAGIRKGTGELHLDVKRAAQEGFPTGGLATLDRLDIVYQTQALPTRVEMVFTPRGGGLAAATRYTYREAEGGVGEMKFQVPDTDLVAGGQLEDLELTTRWAPDGRGLGVLNVLAGDITGAKYTECWDALGRVTFLSRSWDFFNPSEGNRSTCPDFSVLDE